MASSASDDLKIRRFSEGLFSLYEGLVRLPNAMPGRALETLLADIAAFPDGKHDDQVDALSEGHLRGPSLGPQARPSRAAARQGPD
jgi:phage terminase large subunit-like protein